MTANALRTTTETDWARYRRSIKSKIKALRKLQDDARCNIDTYYRLQYEIEELSMEIGISEVSA